MKNAISVLGSTGSIGRQTLDVAKHLSIPVVALTAGSNVERMAQQCREFQPLLAVMGTEEAAKALRLALPNQKIQIMSGKDGLLAAASIEEAATVITAVVGMVGLEPTLAAIRAGKRIGLANKETLVCAGQLVMEEADRYGVEVIPVDSEHSAIFQCLMGCQSRSEVKKLILTCSGGPFFGKNREELQNVTKADALKHPNWKMGAKITIDCATLMNKGLEFIEAMRLYRLPPEKIQIVIHRQSVVHSLVEFVDGAVMAQLGTPDMRLPIQLALTYPNRLESPVEALDLLGCGALTFQQPDEETFPCLKLARDAARLGGTAGAVLSGANEAAVALYLQDKIGFYDIYKLVKLAMEQVPYVEKPTLEEILEADRRARAVVADHVRGDLF